MILIRSAAEIAQMRTACRLTAQCMAVVAALVRPGVTTAQLDRAADATGVFVFRLDGKAADGSPKPIVFRLNMRNPESMFLAKQFELLPEDVVYRMTKAMAQNVASMSAVNKSMSDLTPKGMAEDIGVPFHPGAAKFYKEAGITVATK